MHASFGRTVAGRCERGRSAALGLLLALLAVTAGQPAVASEHRAFSADIGPHQVAAGESVTFAATLTNESGQQQLGAANITSPEGFRLTATDQPSVNGTPVGTATIKNSTLELRDLSAPPGAMVTVGFTATTPCDAGGYTWDVVAKQANNFRGPPGNDLSLHTTTSNLSVDVTGGCGVALRFVEGRQPADAEKNVTISSVMGDADGPPLQVEVIDTAGNRVVNATATIAMALDPESNPGGATLSGTLTRIAVDGVATFDDLRIDLVGADYALEASSSGLDPAESVEFDIWEHIATCTAGETCTSTATASASMEVSASGTGDVGGGAVMLRLEDKDLGCGDSFNHAPLVATLDSRGITGLKTATMTIDRAEVQKFRPNDGAAHYQVCFEADYEFTDRDGNTVTKGLLADCGTTAVATPPCVDKKTKSPGGNVVIGLLMPAADPSFR